MKRMWTEREIRSLAVNSVEKKEDLEVFENIVDKDGHKRFIEGDITINELTGVTQTYGKWSLSGTHLMIVVGLVIASGSSLTDETNIATINLPDWIKDKLQPLISTYVSFATAVGENENWSAVSIPTAIKKSNEVVTLYKVGGTTTATATTYVRFQYDFLIDNE